MCPTQGVGDALGVIEVPPPLALAFDFAKFRSAALDLPQRETRVVVAPAVPRVRLPAGARVAAYAPAKPSCARATRFARAPSGFARETVEQIAVVRRREQALSFVLPDDLGDRVADRANVRAVAARPLTRTLDLPGVVHLARQIVASSPGSSSKPSAIKRSRRCPLGSNVERHDGRAARPGARRRHRARAEHEVQRAEQHRFARTRLPVKIVAAAVEFDSARAIRPKFSISSRRSIPFVVTDEGP